MRCVLRTICKSCRARATATIALSRRRDQGQRAGADGLGDERRAVRRRSWTCSIRWASKSTSCSKPATTAIRRARRPVPRAHRPAGAQEHPVGLRRPAAQRRLHRHRRAQSARAAGSAVRRAQAADRLRQDLHAYEECSATAACRCNDQMKFITEAEHVHSSSDQYAEQFEELKIRLGMDSMYE